MTVITRGRISITPVAFKTEASLAQIHAQMASNLYKPGSVPGAGWGSVHDKLPDPFAGGSDRPTPLAPELIMADGPYPTEVRARMYWDAPDMTAIRLLGTNGDPKKINRLKSVDVSIMQSDVDEGEKIAHVSLGYQATELRHEAIPRLLDIMRSSDKDSVKLDGSDIVGFGNDDFFRWITYRQINNRDLTDDFKLEMVKDLYSKDGSGRPTIVQDAVSFARHENLITLARPEVTFGPATLAMKDDTLDLSVEFVLRQDGSFMPNVGSTIYGGEELDEKTKRLNLVRDLSFVVIRQLREIYYTDQASWGANKATFLQQMHDGLGVAMGFLPQPN